MAWMILYVDALQRKEQRDPIEQAERSTIYAASQMGRELDVAIGTTYTGEGKAHRVTLAPI